MRSLFTPSDGISNDDFNRLPLQSIAVVDSGFDGSNSGYSLPDVSYVDTGSTDVSGSYEHQSQTQPGSGNGSNFTRLSLFWGSFSLLMFNPFVISSSGDNDRSGAHCEFIVNI